jgi:single-strand DNA-binding protein
MASMNKVILMGNLGGEPRWGVLPGGAAVCNVLLATTGARTDGQGGAAREVTEWHRAVMFGELAESVRSGLGKGAGLYLEGRLRTRKWTDRHGATRYITEVVAETARLCGAASGARGGGSGAPTLADPGIAGWIADYDAAWARRLAAEAALAAPLRHRRLLAASRSH